MRATVIVIATVFAALTTAALASCNRVTAPSPPTAPVITRVELIAPGSLSPGATIQLRLIARRSDGSSEDVTQTARFASARRDVVEVSPAGLATALKIGEASVSGYRDDERLGSGREVVVVPGGTYRVVGQVFEENAPRVPVGGARVEADGGFASDSTDLEGRYRLYGVPGFARLRVSKNGYTTKELTLAISDHHTENVPIELAGPRNDVAGPYELTLEAAPSCRIGLPEAAFVRRYDAAVTQSDAGVRMVLNARTFDGGRYVIPTIELGPSGGALEIPNYGHCDVSTGLYLVEQIDDTTHLWVSGTATLSRSSEGFTGTLDGSFAILPGRPCSRVSEEPRSWCPSPSHRVTLTRRSPQ